MQHIDDRGLVATHGYCAQRVVGSIPACDTVARLPCPVGAGWPVLQLQTPNPKPRTPTTLETPGAAGGGGGLEKHINAEIAPLKKAVENISGIKDQPGTLTDRVAALETW